MKYKQIDTILERNQDNLREILNEFSSLIDDTVNFGTNLLKWGIEKNSPSNESLLPLLFFRNILEISDSISILIKASSIDTVKPLLRILLENTYNLAYLLEDNTDKRAMSFIVCQIHKELNIYDKLDTSNQVGKQFKNEILKDRFVNTFDFENKESYKVAKGNAEKLLKSEKYKSIEKEYQDTKEKKKNCSWYSLFNGPKDIQQLANHLKLNLSYEIWYRDFSVNIHAVDSSKNKIIFYRDNSIGIIQIRYPEDAQKVTQRCLDIILIAYSSFYKKILPEKEEDYRNWILEFDEEYKELSKRNLIIIEKNIR